MSQRTKGNAKPSNSERAARLLPKNQFLSFSEASQTLPPIYATTNVASANQDVSASTSSFEFDIGSDFQIIFKHMSKKDINTKLKALQDFAALCLTKEKDDLLKSAKFWFRVYRKLANSIDWRLRQEVHLTQYKFLSSFDRDVINSCVQNASGLGEPNPDPNQMSTSDVSFSNLITMPAIVWASCFDSYSQAGETAKKAFEYLHPTSDNNHIEFILTNYDAILNYFIYSIFDKIPIKLFYSTPLPADSVKVFEEHILVTSLKGLSSLINELLSYYLKTENNDGTLKSRTLNCLQSIYLRLNQEFVNRKNFGKSNLNVQNQASSNIEGDNKEVNEEESGQYLSKKEKRKQQKKPTVDKTSEKKEYKVCKFWSYALSSNNTIRSAFFHALNSMTRLTSFHYYNSTDQQFKQSTFQELIDSKKLWFQLYQNNFYDIIFKNFIDTIPGIRGICWLLVTHLLPKRELYNPWSIQKSDIFLESLVKFISNGMKTAGGLVDFGLFNIDLEKYQLIYPEFFATKYSHLSALQLTNETYSEMNVLANVKLVVAFVESFNDQPEYRFQIYRTLLSGLNDGFKRVVLQKDMDFLIEIYFNLIYHLMQKCLQLSQIKELDANVKLSESVNLNSLISDIFGKYLHNLLITSFEHPAELYFNSLIYLNLLLLANYSNEYYQKLCKDSNYDTGYLSVKYNEFKSCLMGLYLEMFKLIETELAKSYAGIDTVGSKYSLNRLLRFLNDSTLFRQDGYFSPQYYCNSKSFNYDKLTLKVLRINLQQSTQINCKRVSFDLNSATSIVPSLNPIPINLTPPNLKLVATKSWLSTQQQKSMFAFSLSNSKFSDSSKSIPLSISLYDELVMLDNSLNQNVVNLIKLFDYKLEHFGDQVDDNGPAEDELFLIIQHLQYILRGVSCDNFVKIFSSIQISGDLIPNIENVITHFIQNYTNKWFERCYSLCDKIYQQSEFSINDSKAQQSLRFQVLICRKISDVFLIIFSKVSNSECAPVLEQLMAEFVTNMSPFAFCVLIHHLSHLATLPTSVQYGTTIAHCRRFLVESFYSIDTLLYSQLDRVFANSTLSSASLDLNIFIDLLAFLLGQGRFISENSIDTEYKFKTVGQLLTRLYQQLKQFESDARSNSSKVDYNFLVDFPTLCLEIYKIMFQQLENLSFIDNFEETFANFVKLFFRQTFQTIGVMESDDVDSLSCLKSFATNTSNFWSFGIEKFFYTLPRYETIFKILVKDLTSYVMNHIIFADSVVLSSFELINNEVSQFMNVVIFGYKSILSSSLTNDCDLEEIGHVQEQFTAIETKFFQHFNTQTNSFFGGNFIPYLYEMIQEESDFVRKLYSVHDLFDANSVNPNFELLNNADKFQQYVADKFVSVESCLYINHNMATIVENLLKNVYLDSVYENFLTIESAQFLKYKAFTVTNFKAFELFQVVRQLLVNQYHLKCFLNFYFFRKQLQISDPISKQKHKQLLQIFFSLKLVLNSILNLIVTCMDKSSCSKDSVLEFICFLITSQDGTIPSLLFANFCVETHFPEIRWMDVLNHIGLDHQFDISNIASPTTCLFLASTDNVGRIIEIFDKSIEILEEKTTDLIDTDTPDVESKKSIDWSKIDQNELNKILFVTNFTIGKYATLMMGEKLEEYPYFTSRIAKLLTLFANSKFDKLFNSSNLTFTNESCATFSLFGMLYRQYILCYIESFRPLHYASIFTMLKSWFQILYTALPENIEKANSQQIRVLLVGIDILDTFNLFARNAVLLLVPDIDALDSLPEAREMWRNFLAFDSFNLILPLFVVMNNSPNRNIVEQTYLNCLANSIQYVDVECLRDIASLEFNQLLLITPDEKTPANNNTIYRSQNILAKFLPSSSSSKMLKISKNPRLQNVTENDTKVIYLRPSNPYYDFVLKYSTFLLFHQDFKWAMSSYRLLATMIQSSPWLNEEKQMQIADEQDQSDTTFLRQEEKMLAPPEYLCNLLEQLDKVVDYTLMDYEFGQIVFIDSNTDIYNCTLTYLLGWLLFIHLVERFPLGSDDPNETRSDLINFLSKGNLHHRLFDNLFHLMSTDEDTEEELGDEEYLKELCDKQESIQKFLSEVNNLDNLAYIQTIIGEPDSVSLSKLALCVYYQLLRYVPNVLRSWFNNLKHQQKGIVDEFTSKHFSTLLIENELDNFKRNDQTQFGNIIVRTNKKTNEINAIYSLREISFGIKFDFKPNYPLTTIGIECSNRSGVGEERCRKWIQRLTIFFNKQNCSIKDGIIMLRPNMDKFFEDIEECLICLFVLYGTTSQLPRFKCPQCRKKFHWNCIRKWFHTNPSCPQCKYDFE